MATDRGTFRIPPTAIDFQRRLLEFQHTAFTNAFEMAVRLQDQRRDVIERWIERIPSLPEESKALYEAWSEASRRNRDTFRSTVDKSFDLVDGFYERLAAKGEPAVEPAA